MRTFNELKEAAAKEKGYKDWASCVSHLPKSNLDQLLSHLAEIYKVSSIMEIRANRDDNLEKTIGALQGLVNLKKYKDMNGKDDFYHHLQPIVWERANEITDKLKHYENKI